MFYCDWKIVVYLPKPAGDKVIEGGSLSIVDGVKSLMNAYFGGFSIYNIEGGWEGPKGLELESGYAIETVTHRQEHTKQLEHISNFILGHSKEQEVLMTKSPISIVTFDRKEHHD